MERKEETIKKALKRDDEDAYPCVWYDYLVCPIRTHWKLSPENLTGWCSVCKQIGFLDEKKAEYAKKKAEEE